MLQAPSLAPLAPSTHPMPNGNTLYFFANDSLSLVKLDFTFEAGSGFQWKKSLAHAANQLFGEATARHDAQQVAEFLDFRGIVVERMTDTCVGNVSVYFLRRYAEELFPLLREMFDAPVVTPQSFGVYTAHRRQQITQNYQKTDYLARNRFYELLYGFDHPLGTYAVADDVDLLTEADVTRFIHEHYRLSEAQIVLAGSVDEQLLALADRYLAPVREGETQARLVLPAVPQLTASVTDHVAVPNAVQSTIRMGSVLSCRWDSLEYAQFMVLNTLLGGYFGSRLMSNIREDKGYTYGIYSQSQIFRDSIVFYITADVAAEATQPAVDEVWKEIRRLQDEPVSDEELDRVRNVMMGDFIRSIDGTFEVSERYRQMVATDVTERLAENYFEAVQHVTPEQLQTLARKHFARLVQVTAGRKE